MATHSSILAWEIPGTVEPGGLQSWGHKESDVTDPRSADTITQSMELMKKERLSQSCSIMLSRGLP